jgi:hypothetical protein
MGVLWEPSAQRRHRASGQQGLEIKMAYMNQEKKAAIAAELKKVMPQDWKYSLAVNNHSTIVCTIKSAPINLVDIYTATRCSEDVRASTLAKMNVDVNPYYWADHFEGDLLETFTKIFAALNLNNHNRSDIMTDYFDVGHYVDLDLGRWNKPFVCTAR